MAQEKSARKVIKDIAVIAILTVIVFVLEEVMAFLPNIQLTVFLFVLYSKKLSFPKVTIIVLLHTLLDNLVFGSFNIIYTPAMFIGWMIIPIVTRLFLKKVEKPLYLALFSCLFALTYSWIFAIPQVYLLKVDFIKYIIADLPFEGLLILSSFVSTLLLYKPLSKVFDKYLV